MINKIITAPGIVPIIIVQQTQEDKLAGWLSLRKIRTDSGNPVEIRIPYQVAQELIVVLQEAFNE